VRPEVAPRCDELLRCSSAQAQGKESRRTKYSHESLKKTASLALAGAFAVAMAGTAGADPIHHHYAYHHYYHRYGFNPVGAAVGTAAAVVGGAAAAATGYPYGYGYGPGAYYGGYGY
jgi:hypothetical protein